MRRQMPPDFQPRRLERRDSSPRVEHRDFVFDIRAIDETGKVEGYGSVFNTLDAYGDIVAPGCFTKTLAEHAQANTLPAMLWQHKASEPCGKWLEMKEDSRGLYCKGQLLLEVEEGQKVHALLKGGAISGLSIGFVSRAWSWDDVAQIRTVTDVELWEVSFVTFPANPAARVTGVKSVDGIASLSDAERHLCEAGSFSRRDATAFVSRVKRLALQQSESAAEHQRFHAAAERLTAALKA